MNAELQEKLAAAARVPWPEEYTTPDMLGGSVSGACGRPRYEAVALIPSLFGVYHRPSVYMVNGRDVSYEEFDSIRQRVQDAYMGQHWVQVLQREFGGTLTLTCSPGYTQRFKVPWDCWHADEYARRRRLVAELPSNHHFVESPIWRVLAEDWTERTAVYNLEKWLATPEDVRQFWGAPEDTLFIPASGGW